MHIIRCRLSILLLAIGSNICSCLQFEGSADGPSLQRGVGSVRYPSDGSGHGAPVCAPTASLIHPGQLGAGLHGADGRGVPPASTHASRPATPGDPGTERKQADQNDSKGAD